VTDVGCHLRATTHKDIHSSFILRQLRGETSRKHLKQVSPLKLMTHPQAAAYYTCRAQLQSAATTVLLVASLRVHTLVNHGARAKQKGIRA